MFEMLEDCFASLARLARRESELAMTIGAELLKPDGDGQQHLKLPTRPEQTSIGSSTISPGLHGSANSLNEQVLCGQQRSESPLELDELLEELELLLPPDELDDELEEEAPEDELDELLLDELDELLDEI